MKSLIILIIIAVMLVSGYFLLKGKPISAPNMESASIETGMPVQGEENVLEMEESAETVIIFTDNGYVPPNIKTKLGDTVTFENESVKNMWPASAMHPTHAVYPTTGGCLGSTFDACRGVPNGESWSFKFDVKGEWKFHDHLSPKIFGSITVE